MDMEVHTYPGHPDTSSHSTMKSSRATTSTMTALRRDWQLRKRQLRFRLFGQVRHASVRSRARSVVCGDSLLAMIAASHRR